MTIPLAVRPADATALAPTFGCTLCGDCCRGLRTHAEPQWPASSARMASAGYYGLATRRGLQAWAWERARMAREAQERGIALVFVPSLVVADELSGRLLALVYELDHDDCPFLRPGEAPETLVCGAYEARPLVCRAFPVVASGGALVPSGKCPVIVEPATEERDEFVRLFGDAFLAAEASPRLPREVGRLLQALEDAGALKLARGLSREQVGMRLARAPPLDLWEFVAREGFVDEHAWWLRLNPDPARVFTPRP